MDRLSCKDMQNDQKDMDADGLTLCVQSNCRKKARDVPWDGVVTKDLMW